MKPYPHLMRPLARAGFAAGISLLVAGTGAPARATDIVRTPTELKELSLEELLDTKVISASRTLEDWKTAPTAIGVLTSDDIERSGAVRLPDVLRLAPGLGVERYLGSSYAVSARGFSSSSVDKMQVMMDGRSLYTPLFSGVFWEVQDTMLEDLDRIEVVRGPGATLWGANAMNGVINFVTKNARDTQGTLVTAGFGNEERGLAGFRFGGQAGEKTFFRTYLKYLSRDDQVLSNGTAAADDMHQGQGGFRIDSTQRGDNLLTLQGDAYQNAFGTSGRPDAKNKGANVLTRWSHDFSPVADLQVQLYYDYTRRDVPQQFREKRTTYDLDVQQHWKLAEKQSLVWGLNYHNSADVTGTDGTFVFSPSHRTIHLVDGFVQDQIVLTPDRLTVDLGSRFQDSDYSNFDFQPSGRIAFTPTERQTFWLGVSRAVRTPTRVDEDSRFLPTPGFTLIQGNPDFESENLVAYEVGYRVEPTKNFFVDVATYYNRYKNLRTLEPSGPTGFPLLISNKRAGDTYGGEITLTWQAAQWWRLSGTYSLIRENLKFAPDSHDPTGGTLEVNDPPEMATLHSAMNLPHEFEVDCSVRYQARLPNPQLPAYVACDVRLAWHPTKTLELAIVGQNLFDSHHPEFGGGGIQPEVQRSIFGQATWRFK